VSVDLVISDARLRDTSLVGEFVYRAFRRDDPITLWVVPEADDRPAVLPHYFGAVAADAVEHGVVELGRDDRSGDLLAVAIWFDVPEPEPAPPTEPDDRLTELCGRYAGRFAALEALMQAAAPPQPHHHLAFLAVDEDHRNAGLGTAMLEHHHKLIDNMGLAASLDASNTSSRRLYLRHGYNDSGDPFHPPGAPPMWPMLRSANP
jgi:ribosomal protein S18 acetylase RimI-like enzyme